MGGCEFHPESAGVEHCIRCGVELCERCVRYDERRRVVCPRCETDHVLRDAQRDLDLDARRTQEIQLKVMRRASSVFSPATKRILALFAVLFVFDVGAYLALICAPSAMTAASAENRPAHVAAAQALTALRAHQRDRADWPQRLSDLQPDYLPVGLPLDRLDYHRSAEVGFVLIERVEHPPITLVYTSKGLDRIVTDEGSHP